MEYPGRPSEEFYDAGFSEILMTQKSSDTLKTKCSTATSPGSNIKKLRGNNLIFSLLDLMKDSGVSPEFQNER